MGHKAKLARNVVSGQSSRRGSVLNGISNGVFLEEDEDENINEEEDEINLKRFKNKSIS